ncbi:MAG: hypothetical protein DRR16_27500 [Candidatus Parabeggiatoa sp. nov. 3]|nr:MAG: hypothetical protein DRR00_14245 [Gammaproteobacteria bacterium]RKZ78551.1 MAG: hypothetical protein DRR16_27500 [Gammaproteobacteria bacterium]
MQIKDLGDLLQFIKKRPGMYINPISLNQLQHFISGYQSALQIHNIEELKPFDSSVIFHDWVALRTHYSESTSGWVNMILAQTDQNEEEALELFFKYLSEYETRKERILYELSLPKQNTPKVWKKTLEVWKKTVEAYEMVEVFCYLSPATVQIIKYTTDPGVFIRYKDSLGKTIEREDYHSSLQKALYWVSMEFNVSQEDWVKF